MVVSVDLQKYSEVNKGVQNVISEMGEIDILINNVWASRIFVNAPKRPASLTRFLLLGRTCPWSPSPLLGVRCRAD